MNSKSDRVSASTVICWGLIHGLNDLVAGYMLAEFSFSHSATSSFKMLLLYAIIGFGGQLPLGILIDKLRTTRFFAIASLLLLLSSIILYSFSPSLAIFITAMAGAGIHVCGGSICLQAQKNKSGLLGVFTAPGVLGLTIGGLSGGNGMWPLLIAGMFIMILAGLVISAGITAYRSNENKNDHQLDSHDWIMLSLLLLICCRSFLFDVVNFISSNQQETIIIIGIGAFAGKLAGAFLADKYGWKRIAYAALILSAIFLNLGKENIYALAFGIACLQSSVPITLMLMFRGMPQLPATASALSLGTGVAIAGLPFYLAEKSVISGMFQTESLFLIVMLLIMGLILSFIIFRKKIRYKTSYVSKLYKE